MSLKEKNIDAILFSAKQPAMVTIDDAINHLLGHKELYWEVGFSIKRDRFPDYPILGYIHICGGQVEYVATIKNIKPFSPTHYENKELASRVKPARWIKDWEDNSDGCRDYHWKYALVMTSIKPFSYNTYDFIKYEDSKPVTKAPENYTAVLRPDKIHAPIMPMGIEPRPDPKPLATPVNSQRPRLAERNLEDFVIHQLEKIEPGLQLIDRQLSTVAGRLDILCQDRSGWYVVVELKRERGTDQVVGQILRYMGWVQENYNTDKVRGIIVVGKKDNIMLYAVRATRNIQVKEFRLTIE